MTTLLTTNKRGAIIHFVLFGAMAAMAIFLTLYNPTQIRPSLVTGNDQIGFLSGLNEAERWQLFEQQAVRIAADQAMYETALKGGFSTASPCGRYPDNPVGYALWNQKERRCTPDLTTTTTTLLRERLNPILMTAQPATDIGTIGLQINLDGTNAIGLPRTSIELNTFPHTQPIGGVELVPGVSGRYRFSPAFSVNIGRHTSDQEQLTTRIEQLLTCKTQLTPGESQPTPEERQLAQEEKDTCINQLLNNNPTTQQGPEQLTWNRGMCPATTQHHIFTNLAADLLACASTQSQDCWCNTARTISPSAPTTTLELANTPSGLSIRPTNFALLNGLTPITLPNQRLLDSEGTQRPTINVQWANGWVVDSTPIHKLYILKEHSGLALVDESTILERSELGGCPLPAREQEQFCAISNQKVTILAGDKPVTTPINYQIALDFSNQ